MAVVKKELDKNIKNLPDDLIYIIRGFVGSYYPFIEEMKNEVYYSEFELYHVLEQVEWFDKVDEVCGSSSNKIVKDLNSFKSRPEWSPAGISLYRRIKNKENKKSLIQLLKINKVKGRTKLIKEKNINNMINALIKL